MNLLRKENRKKDVHMITLDIHMIILINRNVVCFLVLYFLDWVLPRILFQNIIRAHN